MSAAFTLAAQRLTAYQRAGSGALTACLFPTMALILLVLHTVIAFVYYLVASSDPGFYEFAALHVTSLWRRARDSNPHGLSTVSFQDWCDALFRYSPPNFWSRWGDSNTRHGFTKPALCLLSYSGLEPEPVVETETAGYKPAIFPLKLPRLIYSWRNHAGDQDPTFLWNLQPCDIQLSALYRRYVLRTAVDALEPDVQECNAANSWTVSNKWRCYRWRHRVISPALSTLYHVLVHLQLHNWGGRSELNRHRAGHNRRLCH